MESKLSSLKVPELKQLLTAAGLPISGNKPDLIQRLLENPQATTSLAPIPAASAPATPSTPVPTIFAPSAPASAALTSAPTVGGSDVEGNVATKAPSSNGEASAWSNNGATPQTTSAQGSSEEERRQALIAELEKRKARAAKFGQPLGEAERKLERAIKFGLDAADEAAEVAKLGQALGTRPPTKRGHDANSTAGAEGKKDDHAKPPTKKVVETEEEKQARSAKLEEEREKARKRAERFGLATVDDAPKEKRVKT
uniref:Sap domain-containing protein n=1 Tax=Melanopsichium pennsylvanicum 4 TaxID=1398559 RepID=A0A077R768_9BASI|nr:sap domain-containing protein [Melanopsichium pennsylvanicum 4]